MTTTIEAPQGRTWPGTPLSRAIVLGGVVLAALWGAGLAAAGPIALLVDRRFGRLLRRLFKGRIDDIPSFVHLGITEALSLLTAAVVLLAVCAVVASWVRRRLGQGIPALIVAVGAAFIAVNVFAAIAASTTLYWMALFAAGPNLKQPAFHIERLLLAHSSAPEKVVVLGSSQGHSQVAVGELNRACTPTTRFANLSYAGSIGYDFLLVEESFRNIHPTTVVVYLSPQNFFLGTSGGRLLPFLTPSGLKDGYRWGLPHVINDDGLWYGVMGMSSPLFRTRRAITDALFGEDPGGDGETPAAARGAGVPTREQTIRRIAAGYRVDQSSEFEFTAFREFVNRATSNGATVVLLRGQVHPELGAAITPDVWRAFDSYLDSLAKLPHVRVIRDGLPTQVASDYGANDFMHVNDAARTTYTASLLNVLRRDVGMCAPAAAAVRSVEVESR